MKRRVAIIGSGFSGLAAAAYLAKEGCEVSVFEKNEQAGGRARQFRTAEGFVFDMGPSWYWMPDIFEDFFRDFGREASSFYDLLPLDPQFEMIFSDSKMALPSDYEAMKRLFAGIEPGADKQLDKFMDEARFKYEAGMKKFVRKPCYSWTEFMSLQLLRDASKLDLLTSFHKHVRKFFKDERLLALMEFPVIFLGAMPRDIPALYSLMNYGGYVLKTWYPVGGFIKIIEGMQTVAESAGATIHCNAEVQKINADAGKVTSLLVNGREIEVDAVLASGDYSHCEQMLDPKYRNYSDSYWEKKVFAPSCLIFYLGVKGRLGGLKHHTLFFESDLERHADEIYQNKRWPEDPLFYVCAPSVSDGGVAPQGHENLFLLMPLAPGLDDSEEKRAHYFSIMIRRIERHLDVEDLAGRIVYKRSYCIADFIADYNAYKGNAYGLANTLSQTAVMKPSLKNRKLSNLYYSGQLTVPGPGVPPSLISGKIAAEQIIKTLAKEYEKAI